MVRLILTRVRFAAFALAVALTAAGGRAADPPQADPALLTDQEVYSGIAAASSAKDLSLLASHLPVTDCRRSLILGVRSTTLAVYAVGIANLDRALACLPINSVLRPLAAAFSVNSRFSVGEYDEAAQLARRERGERPLDPARDLSEIVANGARNLHSPAPEASVSWNIRASTDGPSLLIAANINGHDLPVELDSGAFLSILAEKQAKALGLRFLDGRIVMQTPSGNNAEARIARARAITIGSTRLADVLFAVVNDEVLATPGETRWPVLGIPVISRLGMIELAPNGRVLRSTTSTASASDDSNMILSGTPLAAISVAGSAPMTFDVDTGATRTSLYERCVLALGSTIPPSRPVKGLYLWEVGGLRKDEVRAIQNLELQLAGESRSLPEILISRNPPRAGTCGRLGLDVMRDGFRLDFGAMRVGFVR